MNAIKRKIATYQHQLKPMSSISRNYSALGWRDYVRHNIDEVIGKTPLIQLNSFEDRIPIGAKILAKAEFLNPGGSIKDRPALNIVLQGEKLGFLVPHSHDKNVIVEATAGNLGISLCHICNARGYKLIIYMPDTQSPEKMELLRSLGAEVRAVPAVPYTDPNMYQHQAKREAERIGAFYGNQFDNTANRLAHYENTGPEIIDQLGRTPSAFVCATGTGGTLGGVSRFLKEHDPDCKIVLADPTGSCLYNYVKHGKLEREGDGSITEGIANGRVTDNLKDTVIDDALLIRDEKVIRMVFDLLYQEGVYVGASSALNVEAAIEVANSIGPGAEVVTVLCDGADRYRSRLFSKKWLESKNLLHSLPKKYQDRLLA